MKVLLLSVLLVVGCADPATKSGRRQNGNPRSAAPGCEQTGTCRESGDTVAAGLTFEVDYASALAGRRVGAAQTLSIAITNQGPAAAKRCNFLLEEKNGETRTLIQQLSFPAAGPTDLAVGTRNSFELNLPVINGVSSLLWAFSARCYEPAQVAFVAAASSATAQYSPQDVSVQPGKGALIGQAVLQTGLTVLTSALNNNGQVSQQQTTAAGAGLLNTITQIFMGGGQQQQPQQQPSR